MMAHTFACEVEFVGGPIDGHVESMLLPLHSYVGVKVLVSDESQSFLHSLLKKWRAKGTARVAIYELANSGTRITYRYLRTQILSEQLFSPDAATDTLVKRFCENRDAA